MAKFTNFQRAMWYWLTYFSVCRYYITREADGHYKIRKAGRFRLFIYYGMCINTIAKLIYLVLTYRGYLVEVHFMDQMSICDYFLCISQVVQEGNMWYRKYPLFEILHANWKIQEEIFKKLGSPESVEKKRIMRNDRSLVILHLIIVSVGMTMLMLQVKEVPKYALNTYAVVPYDTTFLTFLFAVHEFLFIFHIWTHQASSIVLCEVFAVTWTEILKEMTTVFERLIAQGQPVRALKTAGSRTKQIPENREYFIGKYLHPSTIAPTTEYNIEALLADYTKMMLATTAFNNWIGRLQGGTTASNYGQFVSDVFMMIQLLKEPGTGILDVIFFMEDACAGMVMLFRMLILVSRLYPASEGFLQKFKLYLSHDMPAKSYMLRRQRTLRIIAAKLGGYSTKGITVPKGINTLMNYYIAAAMWQRPTDRLT